MAIRYERLGDSPDTGISCLRTRRSSFWRPCPLVEIAKGYIGHRHQGGLGAGAGVENRQGDEECRRVHLHSWAGGCKRRHPDRSGGGQRHAHPILQAGKHHQRRAWVYQTIISLEQHFDASSSSSGLCRRAGRFDPPTTATSSDENLTDAALDARAGGRSWIGRKTTATACARRVIRRHDKPPASCFPNQDVQQPRPHSTAALAPACRSGRISTRQPDADACRKRHGRCVCERRSPMVAR